MKLRRAKGTTLIVAAICCPFAIRIAVAHEHGVCSFEHNQIISDACASYSTIDKISTQLRPLVQSITQGLDYFGYYRLNLYGKQCPFWSDDSGMCGNIACSVNTIDDEKDIPLVWRAEELSKLTGPQASHPSGHAKEEPSPLAGALGEGKDESCIVENDECDERDYCVPEDESISDGVYVSLTDNPERFTGYAGEGTWAVWNAIYRENCFSKAPLVENTNMYQFTQSFPGLQTREQIKAFGELKEAVLEKPKLELVHDPNTHKPRLLDLQVDDECLEKRVFYRIISGMHASISVHLCWDYLNQSTGHWGPNLDCFIKRFEGHPERIQNIYFNYALVLRAVAKLRNYLQNYTFCTADPYQNRLTKAKALKLAQEAAAGPEIFDETVMFKGADAAGLKEDFKTRFRNVSRIMDCVGCDKCRLWGKIQTQGYGTALKVLFEFDEDASNGENPPLKRTELVALINTLDRLSTSIYAVEKFQNMWESRKQAEEMEQSKLANGSVESQPTDQHVDDAEETVMEMIREEVAVVFDAMIFVIKSWCMLPGKVLHILNDELLLLWDKANGRAPRARTAEWYKVKPVPIRQMRKEKLAAQKRMHDEL